MGLFDSIVGQVSGSLANAGESGQGGLMEIVIGLSNNPQTGGIQELISAFQEKRLGDIVSSWIGAGQNLPISAEQIRLC